MLFVGLTVAQSSSSMSRRIAEGLLLPLDRESSLSID